MSSAPVWADLTSDNKAKADKLFLEGRDLLAKADAATGADAQRQYDEACKRFFAAQQAEGQNVAILLNLGLCYEKQDKRASALRWYRRTAQVAGEKNDPSVKEYEDTAKAQIIELQKKGVSSVTFLLGPGLQDNAELLIDGETIDRNELIREVDKGPHTIEARAPGKKTSRNQLNVDGNDKKLTYTFAMLEEAPISKDTRGRRRLLGALIGGGIIAVTSGVSAVIASQNKSDFDAAPREEQEEGKFSQTKPTIIFVSGLVVGAGIAAYFFFTKPKRETSVAFTPVVSDDQVGVSLFRRF